MKILSSFSGTSLSLSTVGGGLDVKYTSVGFNNSQVYSIALQSDGKAVIGGGFTSYNKIVISPYLVRLNTNGTLDNGFSNSVRLNSGVNTVAIQTGDSKIVIGGNFTTFYSNSWGTTFSKNRLMRLDQFGDFDPSFDIGTGFNGLVACVAIQPNGKIVAIGQFTTFNGVSVNRIVRLNSDGSQDATFSGLTSGFNSSPWALALQSDGKILVGGFFTSYNGTSVNRIVRLNTNGSIDATFSGLTTGFNSYTNTIAVQSDGKIVVGGDFSSYNGTTANKLVRINTNGSIDNTFSVGSGFGGGDVGSAGSAGGGITIQSDGKILVGGEFTTFTGTTQNRIIRLNTNGSKDSTFNIGTGFNGTVSAMAIRPNGNIVIVGQFATTYNGHTIGNIVELTSTGQYVGLDNAISLAIRNAPISYQSDNSNTFSQFSLIDKNFLNNNTNFKNGLSRDLSTVNPTYLGDIVLGGNPINRPTTLGGINSIITMTGQSVTVGTAASSIKFASDQTKFSSPQTDQPKYVSFNLQNDGKFLIFGLAQYHGLQVNYAVRTNADGSIDTTFNNTSLTTQTPAFDRYTIWSALQSDQKVIVVGGFRLFKGVTQNRIIRLNTDGTKDNTFNVGSGFDNDAQYVTIQTGDSKILVGGYFTTYSGITQNNLIRLNTDGSKDTSFNIGSGFNNAIYAPIIVQPDGKIFVAGFFTTFTGTTQNRIIKLNSNGSKDSSFNIGTGFNNNVNGIARQTDGKIIAVGNFTSYNGTSVNRIVRINTNGTIDATFSGLTTGFDNAAETVAVLPSGKILVGGSFITYNGVTVNRIVRLNTDGSRDGTFNNISLPSGYAFNNDVSDFFLLPNGQIIVTGYFTGYNQKFITSPLILNADGSFVTSITSDTPLSYGSDLSASYNSRSLIDYGFLTGYTSSGGAFTANNGLSKSGNNVRLGGSLTGDTSIDGNFNLNLGSTTPLNSFYANVDDGVNGGTLYATPALTYLRHTYLTGSSANILNLSDADVRLESITTTGNTHLSVSSTGISLSSNFSGFKGVTYAADYSSNFGIRSLVDKGYVTGLTNTTGVQSANNGLTKTGTTVFLGGAIIKDTDLTSNSTKGHLILDTTGLILGNGAVGLFYGATDYSSSFSYVLPGNKLATMVADDGAGNQVIVKNDPQNQQFQIRGVGSFKGATYFDDYSANFTPRSIPDIGYLTTGNTNGISTRSGVFTTTGATQSTLLAMTLSTGTTYSYMGRVTARGVNGADRALFIIKALVYRESGGAVIEGTTPYQIEKVQSSGAGTWDATIDANGNDIRVRITGAASTTINWKVILETTNVH